MANLSLEDPFFFSKIRALTGGSDEVFEKIVASGLQEGSSYLALKRARTWAEILVDEKGIIDGSKLQPIIKAFEMDLFLAGQESGAEKNLFQLRALKKLSQQRELLKLLGTVDAPYREPLGEKWDPLVSRPKERGGHTEEGSCPCSSFCLVHATSTKCGLLFCDRSCYRNTGRTP